MKNRRKIYLGSDDATVARLKELSTKFNRSMVDVTSAAVELLYDFCTHKYLEIPSVLASKKTRKNKSNT